MEIVRGEPKVYTDTHTHTHTHTERERERDTHTDTHTEACFMSLVFLRKCRNKTKKVKDLLLGRTFAARQVT